MHRLYCPTCRFWFSPSRDGSSPGKCPRCDASIPSRRTGDANAWLASTVVAALRASRGTEWKARRAQPRRAPFSRGEL